MARGHLREFPDGTDSSSKAKEQKSFVSLEDFLGKIAFLWFFFPIV